MIRKLIILTIIIMIITTIRIENAFDLNSGRIRLKFEVLGFTVYNQIKETPLSQLKSQLFPNMESEPNWYTLNSKSLFNRNEQSFPVAGVLQVALTVNNNSFSTTQKIAILKEVWTDLKNKDYQAITKLQQKLEKQNTATVTNSENNKNDDYSVK